MEVLQSGNDCARTSRMRRKDADYRKEDAENEDAVPPMFTYGISDNAHNLAGFDARWLGIPLDGVNNLKSDSLRKNRIPIKLGRGRCLLRKTRCLRTSPQPISSLESCLRAQFVDAGYQEVRPASGSLLFPHFDEQADRCEMPFHQLNELLSSPGISFPSSLHIFAFAAGKGRPKNGRPVESEKDSLCSAILQAEEDVFYQDVKDVGIEIFRGGRKGNVVEGRIQEAIDAEFDQGSLSSQGRLKRSMLYKKRKASNQPTSINGDLTRSQDPEEASGSVLEALFFSFGVGLGVKYVLESNRNEVESLSKKLKEAEDMVHDLRQQLNFKSKSIMDGNISFSSVIHANKGLSSQCYKDSSSRINASSDCTPAMEDFPEITIRECDGPTQDIETVHSIDPAGQIAELEEEFEAELELLQLNLAKEYPPNEQGFLEVGDLELDSLVDIVHGELTISGLPGMFDVEEDKDRFTETVVHPPNWAVSPRELDRRLRILLQTRQEEQILELEAELKAAENKLEEKELSLQAWKAHVRRLSKPASSGDESTSITDNSDNRIAGQLEGEFLSKYRHEKREKLTSVDDQEAFHFYLKHANDTSAGSFQKYIASSTGSAGESVKVIPLSAGKEKVTNEDLNHRAWKTLNLDSMGVIDDLTENECHELLQVSHEAQKNSQVEQKAGKVTDTSGDCLMKLSSGNFDTVKALQLPCDEDSQYLNTTNLNGCEMQGHDSYAPFPRYADWLSQDRTEAKCSKVAHGGLVGVSRELNSDDESSPFKFMKQGSEPNTSPKGMKLLVSEPKPLCHLENASCTRGSGVEGNFRSLASQPNFKTKKPFLSIEDVYISRTYDIQDQQCSQEFGSCVTAPANTPIASAQLMKQRLFNTPTSCLALQPEIVSTKNRMANVYEKVRYWEELSKGDPIKASEGTETPISPDGGTFSLTSQTVVTGLFPVSFSGSDSDSLWDDDSASDSEGNLGEVLIKRIVEKTRSGSSIVRDVRTMLAELENHETFSTIEENIAKTKLDKQDSCKCEPESNRCIYEVDKTPPAVLDEMISTKGVNACRSLFKKPDYITFKNIIDH